MLRPEAPAGPSKIQLGLADLTQSRLTAVLTANGKQLDRHASRDYPHRLLNDKPGALAVYWPLGNSESRIPLKDSMPPEQETVTVLDKHGVACMVCHTCMLPT